MDETLSQRTERLLVGLDANQLEAVTTNVSPLAVLATAGSGKTGVITRRIVRRVLDGTADADHVLALTFTRRAAGELARRLAAEGIREALTVGTFHAVAARVLRQRWDDQGKRPLTLITSKSLVLAELDTKVSPAHIPTISTEIDWARARLISHQRYVEEAGAQRRRPSLAPERIAEIYSAYERHKKKRRLADFDDLLEMCRREMETDRLFADVQKWRFRHVFVDEFQDINPLQFRLLEAWRGGRDDLCIVGDANQSIYGWNGADPTLCQNIERTYPGITVIRLATNYRSSPQIVEAGKQVLGAAAADTRSARVDGPETVVHRYASAPLEAGGIVDLLRVAVRPGQKWSSTAVLTRTNAQLAPIAAALRTAGIPVRANAGARPDPVVQEALSNAVRFVGRTAVRDWHAELLTSLHNDDIDITPISRDALEALARAVSELLLVDPTLPVAALRRELDIGSGDDAVDLLTFHAAKGLEWDTVVIAGMERGLVPHSGATDPDAAMEERRLLYVAVTRAARELHLTWATSRGEARAERQPSPWLGYFGQLDRQEAAMDHVPATSLTARRRTVDSPVVQWRKRRSQITGLPERSILSDAEVQALSASPPATVDDVAAILGPLAGRRFGLALVAAFAQKS